jgi:hypothetical protein
MSHKYIDTYLKSRQREGLNRLKEEWLKMELWTTSPSRKQMEKSNESLKKIRRKHGRTTDELYYN